MRHQQVIHSAKTKGEGRHDTNNAGVQDCYCTILRRGAVCQFGVNLRRRTNSPKRIQLTSPNPDQQRNRYYGGGDEKVRPVS